MPDRRGVLKSRRVSAEACFFRSPGVHQASYVSVSSSADTPPALRARVPHSSHPGCRHVPAGSLSGLARKSDHRMM